MREYHKRAFQRYFAIDEHARLTKLQTFRGENSNFTLDIARKIGASNSFNYWDYTHHSSTPPDLLFQAGKTVHDTFQNGAVTSSHKLIYLLSLFGKLKCAISSNIDAIERGKYIRLHGRHDVFACEFCGNRTTAEYQGKSWPECRICANLKRSSRMHLCKPLIRFYNNEDGFKGLDEVNELVQHFLEDTSNVILIVVMGSSLKKDSGLLTILRDVTANSPMAHRVRIDDGSLDPNWQESNRMKELFDETLALSCEAFSYGILKLWGFQ